MNSNNTYLGFQPGSSGDVTVSGAGSQWNISGTLEIGSAGVGAVNVNGGGVITTTGGIGLGQNAGSRGTAIVSGTGSLWTYTGGMFVGINSPGTVTVQNGAVVSGDGAALGYFTGGGIGTVTVTGTGSRWTNTSEVAVGVFSQGSITIASGGLFTSANGTQIGLVSGSNGSVTIDGPGSEWTYTQGIAVGSGGNGVVIVQNGGVLSGDGGQLGYNNGATGMVTVTDAGSQWTNTGGLIIGGSGQGTLTIQNGGVVTGTGGLLSYNSGAVGTVTVTGPGSQWTNTGGLIIGGSGQGTLTIQNGGFVTSAGGSNIAYNSGAVGNVDITGSGSQWSYTQGLLVGGGGQGSLTVSNGAVLNGDGGQVGYTNVAVGTVTVTDPGSQWTNTGGLIIGGSGQGTLTIANGGLVTSAGAYIGYAAGSSGSVTVTGSGSQWNNSGNLYINNGTLTINNGGAMDNGPGNFMSGVALTNWADIRVGNGSALQVSGDMDNLSSHGNGLYLYGGSTGQINGNVINGDGINITSIVSGGPGKRKPPDDNGHSDKQLRFQFLGARGGRRS